MNFTIKIGQINIDSSKINSFLVYLFLITLSTAPAFALGEGNRNLLLISLMSFYPIIIFFNLQFYKIEIWIVLLIFSLAIGPFLLHSKSFRLSTIIYSWMFCLTFMAYNRLLFSNFFDINQFKNLLRFLIFSYFSVLIIQQFCVLIGLPIFNLSNYIPSEPWKLNSLSAEPSHSGRIVGLLFFCYLTTIEIINKRNYLFKLDFKRDIFLWGAFIWTMTTMGSSTAVIFLLIIYFKMANLRNVFFFTTLTLFLFFLYYNLGSHSIVRLGLTMKAFSTLDIKSIIAADHSASIRIVPFFIILNKLDLYSINGLFGHGIDSVSSFLYRDLPGAGYNISGGGFFQIWYEYGFFSFLFFLIFSLKAANSQLNVFNFIFWILMVFLYGINSQILWLCIVLLYTLNYFRILNKELKF